MVLVESVVDGSTICVRVLVGWLGAGWEGREAADTLHRLLLTVLIRAHAPHTRTSHSEKKIYNNKLQSLEARLL